MRMADLAAGEPQRELAARPRRRCHTGPRGHRIQNLASEGTSIAHQLLLVDAKWFAREYKFK
jgi:hypothetical protein